MSSPEDPTDKRRPRSPSPFDAAMTNFFKEFEKMWDAVLPKSPDAKGLPMNTRMIGIEITYGPDGRPIIKHFGNVSPEVETMEPIVDVINSKGKFKIIAEMPGIEEKDITIEEKQRVLFIKGTSESRSYYKDLPLPADVNIESRTLKYNNGMLEISFEKSA